MSNINTTTYSPAAFKPAASTSLSSLLRELFQATPLYLFVTALQSNRR